MKGWVRTMLQRFRRPAPEPPPAITESELAIHRDYEAAMDRAARIEILVLQAQLRQRRRNSDELRSPTAS